MAGKRGRKKGISKRAAMRLLALLFAGLLFLFVALLLRRGSGFFLDLCGLFLDFPGLFDRRFLLLIFFHWGRLP